MSENAPKKKVRKKPSSTRGPARSSSSSGRRRGRSAAPLHGNRPLAARRPGPPPIIGISNRPGHGYDSAAVGAPGHMTVSSLPAGHEPVPRSKGKPTRGDLAVAAEEKSAVQRDRGVRLVARGARAASAEREHGGRENRLTSADERRSDAPDLTAAARRELDGVHGLYVPGAQDYDEGDAATRVPYERALIREARNRGMPTLAVCGGSRVFAQEFGGRVAELGGAGKRVHKRGLKDRAHSLSFPDRATLLGGHPGGAHVDAINSTHEKVMEHAGGQLAGISPLPGVARDPERGPVYPNSELVVSATGPDGHPEGFETRHGAPMMGVTSHPEAIYGTGGARRAATQQGRAWSDHVMRSFAEASQTYARRQAVNAQLRAQVSRLAPDAQSHPAVTFAPHLAAQVREERRDRLRAGTPEVRFGRPRSRFGGPKVEGKL